MVIESFKRIVVDSGEVFTLTGRTYTNPKIYAGNGGAVEINGGTLYGDGTAEARILFAGNTVSGENAGGAIYSGGTASRLDLSYIDFSGNTAAEGSAVYNEGNAVLEQVNFFNNQGGVFFNSGTAALTQVVFRGNTGGAFENTGTLTLNGATFSGNTGTAVNRSALNLTGTIALVSDSDKLTNSGTMTWDLSNSSTRKSITVRGYKRLTNQGTLYIKVASGNMTGTYTLATGVSGSISGKNSFTLTGIGSSTRKITVGGAKFVYGSYVYKLTSSGSKILLAVTGKEARSDFNKSGLSDILQVKNQKLTVVYDVSGKYTTSKTLCNLGKWSVLTKEGDYNGDGRSDCLITLNNGKGVMNISTLLNTGKNTSTVSFKRQSILNIKIDTWTCLGGADLNGDKIGDVTILQTQKSAGKKSRAIQVMLLDSNAKIAKKVKAGTVNSNWEVIGFADVDGDGADNILIQHKNGTIAYWSSLTNPTVIKLKNASGYELLGVGDFDGDDADEILWKDTANNTMVEWDKAASSSLTQITLGSLSPFKNWTFGGCGDYDGDARDELLWCSIKTDRLAYGEAAKDKLTKLTVIVN